jgi:UrcA family protein
MFRTGLFLVAALAATTPDFAAAGGLAPRKPETAAATVVLTGLDLSTSAGIAEARKRLTIMSKRLCHQLRDDRKVDDWENYLDCVNDTLASALDRIRTPSSNVARN